MAGVLRTAEGRYLEAFLIAGATDHLAAGMSLMIGRVGRRDRAVAVAPVQ